MSVAVNEPVCKLLAEKDSLRLRRCAEQVLSLLDYPEAELSLSLVTDAAIKVLNTEDRAISSPTDVLSYSLVEGKYAKFRGRLLGDVVISVETAQRQAFDQGVSIEEELLRLLIHGVLHLVGYDHQTVEETQEMTEMEVKLRAGVTL